MGKKSDNIQSVIRCEECGRNIRGLDISEIMDCMGCRKVTQKAAEDARKVWLM